MLSTRIEPLRVNIAAHYSNCIGYVQTGVEKFVEQGEHKIPSGYLKGVLKFLRIAETSFEQPKNISSFLEQSAAMRLVSNAYGGNLDRKRLTEIIQLTEKLENPETCRNYEYKDILSFYKNLRRIAQEQFNAEQHSSSIPAIIDNNPYVYMP